MTRSLIALILLGGLAVPSSYAFAGDHANGRNWRGGRDRFTAREHRIAERRAEWRDKVRENRAERRAEWWRERRRQERREWARERRDHRPAGWDRGKKTGWNGGNVPPGWEKKNAARHDWRRDHPNRPVTPVATPAPTSGANTRPWRHDDWRQRMQQRQTAQVQRVSR
jgi:hypothetical protein